MTISVSTSDPASTTRTFPWPVLEAGSAAFVHGVYGVDIQHRERGRSFLLSHSVEGATMIQRWADQGKVRFACAVAAPVSAYRALHVSSTASHLVQWEPDDLGSHPLFTPMIVSAEDISHRIDACADGVHRLWDGRQIRLPRGARVAVGPTFALQSGLLGLLDFRNDQALPAGRFRVEASNQNGFRFCVSLASDLYRFLGNHRREAAGWNIMTHIVSTALAKLRRDHRDDDGREGWQSFPNLVSLADLLKRKSLPDWTEDEFEPEEVATALYPHKTAPVDES